MKHIKSLAGLILAMQLTPTLYTPTLVAAEIIDLDLVPQPTSIEENVTVITNNIYTSIGSIPVADRTISQTELYTALDYIAQNAGTTDDTIQKSIAQFYEAISPKANTANTVIAKKTPSTSGLKDIGKRLSSLRKSTRMLSFARGLVKKDKDSVWGLHPYRKNLSNPFESGGLFDQRLSGFLTGSMIISDQSETPTEAGFDNTAKQYTLGGDYRYDNKTFIGLAYSHVSGEVDMNSGRGKLNNSANTYILYANYNYDQNWFSNATMSFGGRDFEMKRTVNFVLNNIPTTKVAISNPNSGFFGTSIGGGYDKPLENGHNLTILANLNYTRTSIDAFTEQNAGAYNIVVGEQVIVSTQLDLGIEWRQAISTSRGVVLPQFSVSWTKEFSDKSDALNARYETDPSNNTLKFNTGNSDLSFINLVLGVSMVMPRGYSGFIQYETQQFVDDYQQYMLSAGVRKEF
jgi:uncharacterized protein YhjY with autotransporter beta-barrel domain